MKQVKIRRYPVSGLLELTYRCNYDCAHCYCKGQGDARRELTTSEVRSLLDQLHDQGCLEIVFSGGEPLVRPDFFELYRYAREKGFQSRVYTNASLITRKTAVFFKRYPPFRLEITVNGISENTYSIITGTRGRFNDIVGKLKMLQSSGIALLLKVNMLRQNMGELSRMRRFWRDTLGRPANRRYRILFDPMIVPRLNRDLAPVAMRLSYHELAEATKPDQFLHDTFFPPRKSLPAAPGDRLYPCFGWKKEFVIDPCGRLKFCSFSDAFSVDLKKTSFRDGFYGSFSRIGRLRFRASSPCRKCRLRGMCGICPARACLETGDEQSPVPYYCRFAKDRARAEERVAQ